MRTDALEPMRDEIELNDVLLQAKNLARDINEWFSKDSVFDFIISTSITVLSATLLILVFKMFFRSLFL
jgi:hypothetical protein